MPNQNKPAGLRALLYREILGIIESGAPLPDEEFNAVALRLFRFQLSANPIYRGFFDAGRRSAPSHWKMIPALPSAAFKRAQITAFPPDAVQTWFETSGTTESETGRHYFETLEVYEKAVIPPFKRFLLPDSERMRMEFLTPPPAQLPHSSLVHMMDTVRQRFGTTDSGYHGTGSSVNMDTLSASLTEAAQRQHPVFLLGTAFAFVHALEEMSRRGLHFDLPFGSRIMETGGFKGRSREISRPDFYAALSENFSIPVFNIVNEYGMTELSSQFYDCSLRDQAPSEQKFGPEWTRVVIVNPETGVECPCGTPGLIKVIDLANVGSVMSLQTEDVGIASEDGSFRIMGRVERSSPRGCSLAMEPLHG